VGSAVCPEWRFVIRGLMERFLGLFYSLGIVHISRYLAVESLIWYYLVNVTTVVGRYCTYVLYSGYKVYWS